MRKSKKFVRFFILLGLSLLTSLVLSFFTQQRMIAATSTSSNETTANPFVSEQSNDSWFLPIQ
jgi:CHASE3 domain sensor protein